MELLTAAEKRADAARHLASFSNFSLVGVRQEIAQLLALIGRVEGLFSTYTIHDISHIDKMLRMLDWLIPERTKKAFTDADWLMVVLAIYLHDLGMVVTADEFRLRSENREFTEWRESLSHTTEGREYLARISEMNTDDQERFFFQEYIRKGHASRIREWITGRHSRRWGNEISTVAMRVAELLRPLPSRFREHLAVVCESHHSDNLKDVTRFPICTPCGEEPETLANVQYAAVLLRTTDLLHVTKDRTPSEMYRSLRLSDPKAVDEWGKQLGTFTVRPVGRTVRVDAPDTAVIVIHADFSEERPLFALQEYITYANAQVAQSKQWVDTSRDNYSDAADYLFPWHTVRGDVRLEGVPPQPMRFELDRGRLLDLLVGHTIYNDPTVAVRELLQNAIDAVRYQHHIDRRRALADQVVPPSMGRIFVRWDPATRMLVIEDQGIGMSRAVIENNLMRVGASFYNSPDFESANRDFVPISRFGIGILTCFMVSDDIEIVTVSGGYGHRLRMTSVHADYLLRELPAGDTKLTGIEPHGTRVSLRLRADIDLSEQSVEDIVRYWVVLPECEVYYQERGNPDLHIGFKSPAEALRYFIETAAETPYKLADQNEILTKQRRGQPNSPQSSAQYDLAYLVEESKWLPDRRFVTKGDDIDVPAVCIEGIRVADDLPWFNERGILALLSVRNDRTFRTTVSRAGLEVDPEYSRVGALCLDMAFEHIADEVQRIAGKPGQPLSQSSTAARWLINDLEGSLDGRAAMEELDSLTMDLPCLVIEQANLHDKVTLRSMISVNTLHDNDAFWTVESRLVDSLGIISRDLGRELSLHQFLATLAPDYTQLRYSPLLPDAHLFHAQIRRSYVPTRVEFSLQHQQSAVYWTKRRSPDSASLISIATFPLDKARKVALQIRESRMRFTFSGIYDVYPNTQIEIDIADITGDDAAVDVVNTRMGPIVRPDSAIARFWIELGQQIRPDTSEELIAEILLFASVVKTTLSSMREHDTNRMWRLQAEELNNILLQELPSFQVPTRYSDLLPERTIFDAERYWMNWASREIE